MATLLLLRFLLIWYFHVEILQSTINTLINYLAQRYCRIIYLVIIISIDYHKTIRKQLLDDGVDDIDDKMVMLIIFMMRDDVGDFDDKMAMMTMIPIKSDDYK